MTRSEKIKRNSKRKLLCFYDVNSVIFFRLNKDTQWNKKFKINFPNWKTKEENSWKSIIIKVYIVWILRDFMLLEFVTFHELEEFFFCIKFLVSFKLTKIDDFLDNFVLNIYFWLMDFWKILLLFWANFLKELSLNFCGCCPWCKKGVWVLSRQVCKLIFQTREQTSYPDLNKFCQGPSILLYKQIN